MRWITFLWCLGFLCSVLVLCCAWTHNPFAAAGFFLAAIITVILIERECR